MSQNTRFVTVPSVRGARTVPSTTTTSWLSMRRVIVIVGLPVNPSSTMCFSNSSFPRTWKNPGISHSTSSVRVESIWARSVFLKPSRYLSTVALFPLIAGSTSPRSLDWLGEHDPMAVRRTDDELPGAPWLVLRLGDHFGASRRYLAMILIQAVDTESYEPRMIPRLAGSLLVRTFAQHHFERVLGQKAPAL